ncbi:MAG: UPF0175 family protein [Gemmataceae bacterium]
MPLTFNLPYEMEARLRVEFPNLDREALEAVALDLFRKSKISHFELGQLLELDRFETDEFLIQQQEYAQSPSLEDLEKDYQTGLNILKELGR